VHDRNHQAVAHDVVLNAHINRVLAPRDELDRLICEQFVALEVKLLLSDAKEIDVAEGGLITSALEGLGSNLSWVIVNFLL
jgi:hypothetical protein